MRRGRGTCRAAAEIRGSERVRVYVFTVGPPWLERHGHLRRAMLCVATSGAKRSSRPPAVYDAGLWRNSPHLRSVMVQG